MTTANAAARNVTVDEFLDVNAAQPGQVLEFDGQSVNWAPAPSPQLPAVVAHVTAAPVAQALGERSASAPSSRSSSPTEWQDAEDAEVQTEATTASATQAPVDLISSWVAAPEFFRQQAREREEAARRAQGRCTIC